MEEVDIEAVSESISEAATEATDLLGRVTAQIVDGEVRTPQVQMCQAVATAIERRRSLIVQAGTGTGKSLAYLVPALGAGRRVVVATATKALQDQLANKDLPLIARALDRPVNFAVLKGRSNYLCRQRVAELRTDGQQQSFDDAPAGDLELDDADDPARHPEAAPVGLAEQVLRLAAWSEETATGDRADLAFEPSPRAWSMVSVGPRECPGAFRCPSGARCFAEDARAAANAADVVVVNTHLYGSHLASGGLVLPEHDVVVFDEAHELEEVMTSSLGVELTGGRLRSLAGLVRSVLKGDEVAEACDALIVTADRLVEQLRTRVGARVLQPPPDPDAPVRHEPEGRERVRADGPTRSSGVDAGDAELASILELLDRRVANATAFLRRGDDEDGPDFDRAGRQQRAMSAATHLAEDLARMIGRSADEVAWVDGPARAPVLRLSPIDVAPLLSRALWESTTAVLTSATIPPRLSARLGLDDFGVEQLDVGSPFDFRSHALLYVARHLPDRRTPQAEAAIHDELEALITAAGGRTLALFTSRRATEEAVAALRPRLRFTLLAQGDLPKNLLLSTFAEDESTCLFATLGFWQGVDVPGRSLSLVTVDRLPFGRPDDPVLEARRERAGDAAFRLVDLPRAATLLAQGTGRLIRSASDHGVVAILDPRLATAGYRGVLLAALPPMRRTTDRRQVEAFLSHILDGQVEQ